MAHYILVHAVDNDGSSEELIYWKYQVPPFFYPLFIASPYYINGCIACDSEEGIIALQRMYDFIDKYKEKIFTSTSIESFINAKQKIIQFLNLYTGDEYVINAEDVFNMSDEDHDLQAESLYEGIQCSNTAIFSAIENDNLDDFLAVELGDEHFPQTIRSLLDDVDIYDYGLECLSIDENLELNKYDQYIFTKNKKKGLKNNDGSILIEPIYDEFKGFVNVLTTIALAPVLKNKRWGVVNHRGELVVEPIYDDIYQFYPADNRVYVALVCKNNAWGLINHKGELIIPLEYDDLEIVPRNEEAFPCDEPFCLVTKNKEMGIVSLNNKILYPLGSYDIEVDDYNSYNYSHSMPLVTKHNNEGHYYLTHTFSPVFKNLCIDNEFMNYQEQLSSNIFVVKNNQGQTALMDLTENLLLDFSHIDHVDNYAPRANVLPVGIFVDDLEGWYDLARKKYLFEPKYQGTIINGDIIYLVSNKIEQYNLSKYCIEPLNEMEFFQCHQVKYYNEGGEDIVSAKINRVFKKLFSDISDEINNIDFSSSALKRLDFSNAEEILELMQLNFNHFEPDRIPPEDDTKKLEIKFLYDLVIKGGVKFSKKQLYTAEYYYTRYYLENNEEDKAINSLNSLLDEVEKKSTFYFQILIKLIEVYEFNGEQSALYESYIKLANIEIDKKVESLKKTGQLDHILNSYEVEEAELKSCISTIYGLIALFYYYEKDDIEKTLHYANLSKEYGGCNAHEIRISYVYSVSFFHTSEDDERIIAALEETNTMSFYSLTTYAFMIYIKYLLFYMYNKTGQSHKAEEIKASAKELNSLGDVFLEQYEEYFEDNTL